MKRNTNGFTLIELMIVVMIIGILAAVALPQYVKSEMTSKTVEAKTNLEGIRTQQNAFLATMDTFSSMTTQPASLPGGSKAAFGVVNCASTCARKTPQNCTSFACIGFAPSGKVYYQYGGVNRLAVAKTSPEFAVGALGDLDSDGQTASYAWQSAAAGSSGVLADGLSACTAGRKANTVVTCTYGKW